MALITGGPGDDSLDGGDGDDAILGAGGDDTLGGRDGADLITGDEGDDQLYGGVGDDLVSGGADNDQVYGEDGGDQLNGNAGNDIISGGAGNDWIAGGAGDDILYGQAQFGVDFGNDTVSYYDATSSVVVDLRLQGHTQVTGGGGLDYMTGFENLSGSSYDDTLKGTDGANGIYGGDGGVDRLYGYGGADTLTGAGELNGGDGDDRLAAIVYEQVGNVLCGGAGNDTLEGAGDSNFAAFFDATAGVQLDLRITGAQDTGSAGVDTLSNINNIFGSAFNDVLHDRDDMNFVLAGGGDDIVYTNGTDGTGEGDSLDGGGGVDTLAFNDVGPGSQPVWSQGVRMDAGTGTAPWGLWTVRFANFEQFIGTKFVDSMTGGYASETLFGLEGNDTLKGMGGADTLFGGAGNDELNGGDGADTVDYSSLSTALVLDLRILWAGQAVGALGFDRLIFIENLVGTAQADTFIGNAENNRLIGNAGADSLSGLGANDVLNGGNGADSLSGDAGSDQLIGGSKDDLLKGGGDNDTLWGGEGADRVSGGAGIDIFRFDSIKEIPKGEVITDLANFDAIDLSRIDADATTAGDQAFVLVASFGGHAGEMRLRYVAETNETRLLLDVNGDGNADATLVLSGDHRGYNAFVP